METQPTVEKAAASPEIAPISIEGMRTDYSNMVRGLMTPEEVILDFGMNPNFGGKIVDEPVRIHSRIILSLASAVRLHQLLQTMLTKRQEAAQQAAQQVAATGGTPSAAQA